MAEEYSQDEKTEQPTPRRREKARKRGQVARSQELNSVVVIFFGVLALMIFSSYIFSNLVSLFHFNLANIYTDLNIATTYDLFISNGSTLIKTVAPVLILVGLAGLLINLAQVGVMFTLEPLTPKLDKLDIIKGLKRLFSTKTLFELFRDTIKVFIIGYVAFITLKGEMNNYIPLADQEVGQIMSFATRVALKVVLRAVGALLFLAILDYAYQKFEFEKKLRMTKKELKEEFKQYEGDPLIKSRIRRIQREMARTRMLQEIPDADVVITNPTHIAVALKYDADTMSAPKMIAKGERLLAEKIKEIAVKAAVPIVENKPLAKALFEAVEVGMMIPPRLFKAVAEVLAYVYKLKGKI
ncbi:MAG: flagellar biosynthesis protein FlhB [Candidatus Zixiibacteriota bacterium]|nr:MAG: flagellar biosynthesis protein FlhB [candidate division Zixibacteria bacterium]